MVLSDIIEENWVFLTRSKFDPDLISHSDCDTIQLPKMFKINTNSQDSLDLTNHREIAREVFLQNAPDKSVERLLPAIEKHLGNFLIDVSGSNRIRFKFSPSWYFPDGLRYDLPYFVCLPKESDCALGLMRISYGERLSSPSGEEVPVCRLSLVQGVIHRDSRIFGIGSIRREMVEFFISASKPLITRGWQIEARVDREWGMLDATDITKPYFCDLSGDNPLRVFTPDFFDPLLYRTFSRKLDVTHRKVRRILESDLTKFNNRS